LGRVSPCHTRADVAKYWNEPPGEGPDSRGRQFRFNRGGWPVMGAFTMGCPKFLLVSAVGFARLPGYSRPSRASGRLRARKNSAPGILPSARREKSSRPDRGLPKKVRFSTSARGVRRATGQRIRSRCSDLNQ
jgi:hypothetical protein